MGQKDLFDYLKKNKGKAFTTLELSRIFGHNRQTISRCASRLKETDPNIVVIQPDKSKGRYGWLIKYE